MFYAGVFFICDEYDLADTLQVLRMDSLISETKQRGIVAVLASGDLGEWKRAMLEGCACTTRKEIREVFNKIKRAFDTAGLQSIFNIREAHRTDGTFQLEDKR
jgi:hypothetical protein